jgi:hypothetical protein
MDESLAMYTDYVDKVRQLDVVWGSDEEQMHKDTMVCLLSECQYS